MRSIFKKIMLFILFELVKKEGYNSVITKIDDFAFIYSFETIEKENVVAVGYC